MGRNQLLHITTLLKRLGIVLLLFTLCRILFYLFNAGLFPDVTLPRFLLMMLLGLRYDVAAILMINILFILMHVVPNPWRERKSYQAVLKVLFYTFNGAALILESADFIYYEFAHSRTSVHLLGLMRDIPRLIPQFVRDFWYMIFIIAVLIVGVEFLYRKASRRLRQAIPQHNYALQSSLVPVVLVLLVAGVRGFNGESLSPSKAARYVSVDEVSLVTNTTFNCAYSLLTRRLEERAYLSSEDAAAEFPIFHEMKASVQLDTAGQPIRPNVVVLIMESFSREYVGFYNEGNGFTPCLDTILTKSLVFDRAFANGKHSIDGLSSVTLGLPALMEDAYISSPYLTNDVRGLGALIKPLGYTTLFFHGGEKGTLSFDKFIDKAGFDHWYSMEEYGNMDDFDGSWGIYDEPFLQFTAEQLNATPQPFCGIVFSLSSHHPFTIPEEHREHFKPTDFEMEAPVRYADYALGQFFKTASQQPWFRNTIFIITADHTGMIHNEDYNNHVGYYAIPMAIYNPSWPAHQVRQEVVQQTDILPTILHLVGYEGEYMAFGTSLLDADGFKFSVSQMNQIAQIISGDHLLLLNDSHVQGFYNYFTDPMLRNDLKGEGIPAEKILERKLKAVLQQYRHALIHNDMIPA